MSVSGNVIMLLTPFYPINALIICQVVKSSNFSSKSVCKRSSLTRGSNYSDLTWKCLLFWKMVSEKKWLQGLTVVYTHFRGLDKVSS